MAWTDQLRPAFYRGAAFRVESHEASGGRRAVVHEFPLREKPYVEDMGQKDATFTVDAYVVGDDYFDQRDKLIEALRRPGTGELVHPYLGYIFVICTGWTLRESVSEGRMARFSMTFADAGIVDFPSEDKDPIASAAAAADVANGSLVSDFADKFSVEGLSDFFTGDAATFLTDAANQIGDLARTVNNEASGALGFLHTVNVFTEAVTSLIHTPIDLANQFLGLVSGVTSLFDAPLSATKGLFTLFDYGSDVAAIAPTTSARTQQQANRAAIFDLVQRSTVVQAAQLAPTATYDTTDDAETVRDTITDKLDDVMADPLTPDDVFTAMQDLRTNVVDGVPPPDVALPNLTTYTPAITMPSLVIAYALYENASREAEIVTRNSVRYPGFVPGAEPLKVLTSG